MKLESILGLFCFVITKQLEKIIQNICFNKMVHKLLYNESIDILYKNMVYNYIEIERRFDNV